MHQPIPVSMSSLFSAREPHQAHRARLGCHTRPLNTGAVLSSHTLGAAATPPALLTPVFSRGAPLTHRNNFRHELGGRCSLSPEGAGLRALGSSRRGAAPRAARETFCQCTGPPHRSGAAALPKPPPPVDSQTLHLNSFGYQGLGCLNTFRCQLSLFPHLCRRRKPGEV